MRWRASTRRARERPRAVDRPAGNAAEILPELARRDVESTSSPTRRARTTRSTATSRGADGRAGRRAATRDPDEYLSRVGESVLAHVGAIRELAARGAEAFDYGNALRGLAPTTGTRTRSPTPASCPPTSARSSARARGRSAGLRCRATPRTSTRPTARSSTCSATRSTSRAGSRSPRERVHFQGLPARICWLGYGERDLAGAALQRDGGDGRAERPDRDRARPPRRRLGRLARARDRGHARRLRRRRRLADPERAAQHGLRRELGVDPPGRRRRHGQVDPRRPGRRRRRHRRRPPSACAG